MPQAAQAACLEDYDSDEGAIKPGTRVEAKSLPCQDLKSAAQRPARRDAASDSGYSSHTSATLASASSSQGRLAAAHQQAASKQSAPPSPTQSKPAPKRQESSSRSRPAAPSRSTSVSKSQCADRSSNHQACISARNTERRYIIAQQQQAPAQPQAQARHYPQHGQPSRHIAQPYQYQQGSFPQPIGALDYTPRPRAMSASRQSAARPQSYHAGMTPGYSMPYNNAVAPAQHGPPPSPSAYVPYGFQGPQYLAQPGYIGTTPPDNIPSGFPQHNISPPSPQHYAPQPAISARQSTAPPVVSYDQSGQPRPSIRRGTSANRTSARYPIMPGAFPPEAASPDYSSSSDSLYTSSESDDPEYERRRPSRHGHHRDSKMMPPPPPPKEHQRRSFGRDRERVEAIPRRPSIKERGHTEPVISQSSRSREQVRRAPHSDTGRNDHHPSSHSHRDATRPVVNQHRSTHASRSRQPSVSTNTSGRTRATTLSSGSGSGPSNVVTESSKGRRVEYLSTEEAKARMRRQQQQQKEQQVEAYQDASRGGVAPPALTAENITGSRDSGAFTRRSSANGKSQLSRHSRKSSGQQSRHSGTNGNSNHTNGSGGSEGIQIRTGDATLFVYGDADIQMRAGEDGGPAQLIIGSAREMGEEGSFVGSRSSGSRAGKGSRQGSELGSRGVIREEDGYERGL